MDYSRELASIYAISFIVSLHLVLQSSVQTFDVMGLSARQADEAVPGLHLQPWYASFTGPTAASTAINGPRARRAVMSCVPPCPETLQKVWRRCRSKNLFTLHGLSLSLISVCAGAVAFADVEDEAFRPGRSGSRRKKESKTEKSDGSGDDCARRSGRGSLN